jgi:hypothetical protein
MRGANSLDDLLRANAQPEDNNNKAIFEESLSKNY